MNNKQYIITVEINGFRRKVGPIMTEEEVLKALDVVEDSLKPEIEELTPPKEDVWQRFGRTGRPSSIVKDEMRREWVKVGLRRCLCGSTDLHQHVDKPIVKCFCCGDVKEMWVNGVKIPRTKIIMLRDEPKWEVVK